MDIQKAIHVLFNECEIIYDMTNFNIEEYKKEQRKQLEAIATIKQELDKKDKELDEMYNIFPILLEKIPNKRIRITNEEVEKRNRPLICFNNYEEKYKEYYIETKAEEESNGK